MSEIESLRQQLAAAKEREQTNDTLIEQQGDKLAALHDLLDDHLKREVMLRDALYNIKTYADTLDDANNWCDEALAATDDLKNVRLCHAEPVGMMHESGNSIYAGCDCSIAGYTVQVFRAWRPK